MSQLYPQSVKGNIRKLKWILNAIFIIIYLGAPYLRYERGEGAPNQAILIDFKNSMGYFFGIEMWPDEVYYIMGLLILAALVLFFVTSLFGRVWCGYACFQTVWTDIFIAVEKIFQGDRNQRMILDRKNSFERFYKKSLTHLTWIIIALGTGYGFTAYYSDAFVQFNKLINFEFYGTALWCTLGIGAATYIMAGYARETVCAVMCPYARFQAVMFDRDTLVVAYDEKRGEPRGSLKTKDFSLEPEIHQGDCIDCKQCVVVCPAGIDIRNGLQMECIACGLCIDACNGIMDKIDRPRGLIRYDTQNHLSEPKKHDKFHFFKPRFFFYLSLITAVCSLLLYSLLTKSEVLTAVTAKRNPSYVMLSDGSIRNSYNLKITNKTHQQKIFKLKITSPELLTAHIKSYGDMSMDNLVVKKAGSDNFRLFIIAPKQNLESLLTQDTLSDRGIVTMELEDQSNNKKYQIDTIFIWQ